MGWSYCPRRADETPLQFLRRKFSQTHVPGKYAGHTILHDELSPSGYFAILRVTDRDNAESCVFCLVCLVDIANTSIGYKDMDESMGPYAIAPPDFIRALERLIPVPPNADAREWRERCRARDPART